MQDYLLGTVRAVKPHPFSYIKWESYCTSDISSGIAEHEHVLGKIVGLMEAFLEVVYRHTH